MLEQDLNLVRKIVWGFVRRYPGLEFDDLFSEACLIYLETQDRFDPNRGKLSTFMWHTISNGLQTHLQTQARHREELYPTTDIPTHQNGANDPENWVLHNEDWNSILHTMSPEARAIYTVLLQSSTSLPTDKPRKCRGILVQILRDQGWAWGPIWNGFRELRELLQTA